MKHLLFLIAPMFLFCAGASAQDKEPWKSNELLAPATLAADITQGHTKDLLILSVGPDAIIKGSVDIGPANEESSLDKLKSYLKDVSTDKEIIIYCGCCPFEHCPNIRPAFTLLKNMGFKNPKLLNLPNNIKADWLDWNYPSND